MACDKRLFVRVAIHEEDLYGDLSLGSEALITIVATVRVVPRRDDVVVLGTQLAPKATEVGFSLLQAEEHRTTPRHALANHTGASF